jgi:hypothetical protein
VRSDGVFRHLAGLSKGCTLLARLLPYLEPNERAARSLVWALLRNLPAVLSDAAPPNASPQVSAAVAVAAVVAKMEPSLLCGCLFATAVSEAEAASTGWMQAAPDSCAHLLCTLFTAATRHGLAQPAAEGTNTEADTGIKRAWAASVAGECLRDRGGQFVGEGAFGCNHRASRRSSL